MDWRRQSAPASAETKRDEQLATLDAADEHLTSILAKTAALHEELERLRKEGIELLRALAEHEAASAEREVTMSALEEESAKLRLQADVEGATLADSKARLEEERRRVQALERDVETLRSEVIERDRSVAAARAELTGAQEELTRRVQSLAQEKSRVEAAESALTQAERRAVDLSRRLETEARQRERLQSVLARVRMTPRAGDADPAPAPEPDRHLRFVPRASGYALSEAMGPPPGVGDLVEVDGRRFAVTKRGRSPLPADRRRCVFLVWDADQTPRSGEGGASGADDTYAAAQPID